MESTVCFGNKETNAATMRYGQLACLSTNGITYLGVQRKQQMRKVKRKDGRLSNAT